MVKINSANKLQAASLVLRIGLAFCFLYAAYWQFRKPQEWIGFIPHFTTRFVTAEVSLKLVSALQIVVTGWLLWGKWLRYSAAIALVLLLGIIVFNTNTMFITFRDVGLACMAVALVFLDL